MKPFKILDSFGVPSQKTTYYEAMLKQSCNESLMVKGINHRKILGINRAWSPLELDCLYRRGDRVLLKLYDLVRQQCEGYDALVVNHENVYHPEFIRSLGSSIYTVLYTGDDPEGSYACSQPYVWAFDHALCYAVYYNQSTLMTEKLKHWGAKRADVKPYGFQLNHYDPSLSENELFSSPRNIEVLYVGGPYNKVSNLMYLKKVFGKRFKIYGNWGGMRGLVSRYIKQGIFSIIKPLDEDDFIYTYRRAKVGINMHMSYGPSNLRMWELPINGILQVTDNPLGTEHFFERDKEIICYENNNMDEAIAKIEYYLLHEKERAEIALAGYRKAKNCYSFSQTWLDIIPVLKAGIQQKHTGN